MTASFSPPSKKGGKFSLVAFWNFLLSNLGRAEMADPLMALVLSKLPKSLMTADYSAYEGKEKKLKERV